MWDDTYAIGSFGESGKARKRPPSRPAKASPPKPSPAERPDRLRYLGDFRTLTDGQIGEKWKITRAAVSAARNRRHIPPVPCEVEYAVDFGVLCDAEIAKKWGRSRSSVGHVRTRCGIPPIPQPRQRGPMPDVEYGRRYGEEAMKRRAERANDYDLPNTPSETAYEDEIDAVTTAILDGADPYVALPCPACGAKSGKVCRRVSGTRIRNGIHPARKPPKGPIGRPKTTAREVLVRLDAKQLAIVDRERGAESHAKYLLSRIPKK